jgi:ankyrin repeat protein
VVIVDSFFRSELSLFRFDGSSCSILSQVTYLLERGAKVQAQALCGATALHFAAECGHVAVCKELLDRGAKLLPNENGNSFTYL